MKFRSDITPANHFHPERYYKIDPAFLSLQVKTQTAYQKKKQKETKKLCPEESPVLLRNIENLEILWVIL